MLPITSLATVAEPWESTAQVRESGDRGAGGGRGAVGRARLGDERRGAGPVLRTRFACPPGRPAAGFALRAWRDHRARRRPGAAGRVDAGRPGGRDRPDRELVETALFFRDRRAA
jgi:magnesium chelatase family protein